MGWDHRGCVAAAVAVAEFAAPAVACTYTAVTFSFFVIVPVAACAQR